MTSVLERLHVLLLPVAAASMALALLVASRVPPSRGYELSIYEALPIEFWVAIGVVLTSSTVSVLREAFDPRVTHRWIVGIALNLLASILVLALPIVRGYAFYGRLDPMEFLGFVKDIESTGRLGPATSIGENFYPASHLVAASVSAVTALDARLVVMAGPPVLFAIHIGTIICLARAIAPNRTGALVVAGLSAAPVLGWFQGLMTAGLYAFSLMPTVLLVHHLASTRGAVLEYGLLLLVLMVMPLAHPLNGGPFLVILLLCLFLGGLLRHARPLPIAIVAAVWLAWVSSFYAFQQTLRLIATTLVEIRRSEAVRWWTWVVEGDLPFLNTFVTIMLNYLPTLVYGGLGLVASGVLACGFFGRQARFQGHEVGFSMVFMAFLLITVGAKFSGFEVYHFRSLPFMVLSASFSTGLILFASPGEHVRKSRAAPLLTAVAVATALVGVATVHRSPLTKTTNPQVTLMDMEGARWFFTHQDGRLLIDQIAFVQRPYVAGLFGARVWPRNVRNVSGDAERPPAHFGHDRGWFYGEILAEPRYFVADRLSRLWREEGLLPSYRASGRWTLSDFNALERDPTVSRLYSNGEFEVFVVNPVPEVGQQMPRLDLTR